MSEHNKHHGREPDHEQVESSVLQPKPVLMFLSVLFIATAFVFIVVRGLDWALRKLDEPNQGQAATQVPTGRQLPPEPLLQGAPGPGSTETKDDPTLLPLEDMARVRKASNDTLNSYGWVDKPGGIARLPIDRAKSVIAEKGLPALPSAAISEELQKAETVRKEILDAGSSGGRVIKVQRQTPQSVQRPATPSAPPEQEPQQVPPQKH